MKAVDLKGRPVTLKLDKFPSRIFQHEYDHLQVCGLSALVLLSLLNPSTSTAATCALFELKSTSALCLPCATTRKVADVAVPTGGPLP